MKKILNLIAKTQGYGKTLESSLSIDRLRAHFEAEIKKQLHREEKLKKEADRYYRLWQDAVSELRSKGDIIDLLIQLEDLQKLCDSLFFVKAALVILELPMIIR